ncbi:hypothetical protein [Dactylosporangium sp. CA-139066]|uniref:hypothetical protein n=1 Tax=Dactylosporangium sp. CA-139066 TaxID=3239930 RepID=UPI003D8A5469
MRLRIVALTVVAGLGLGALGGCGSEDSSEPVTAPPPSIVPTTVPSAPGSGSSLRPDPQGSTMSIHGTIREGVEPGCVLLATDAKTYLLIGGDKAMLKTGSQVTVYGVEQNDLMTTCQQGTPFKVTRVEQ